MDTFTTPRLFAERLHQHHLDELTRLHADPEVMRFVGGVRTPETTASFLRENLAHWDRFSFGLWIFRNASGAFVGRAGLRHIQLDGVEEVEVAYTLDRREWGAGYATEIAQALVHIWREKIQTSSLVGVVDMQNLASARVLIKAGLTYERDAVWRGQVVGLFRRHLAVG